MKEEMYACVHVAEFPVQTLVRLRHDLKGKPVLVTQGKAPTKQSARSISSRNAAEQHSA